MKLLRTRAGSYLTGDDLADAVLDYDVALSQRRTVALITLPFLDDGLQRSAQFTIGWHTDASAVTRDEFEGDELTAPDSVHAFRTRAAELRPSHAEPFELDEFAAEVWASYE